MRFTFTQKFGSTPSESDYNTIKDDFLDYINTVKLDKNNLEDESIRFRHLKRSPAILLFKDCGNDIWSAHSSLYSVGTSGSWELFKNSATEADNVCQIEYALNGDEPGTTLVEFTFWYYPYSFAHTSEVAPGMKVSGVWTPLVEHRRSSGIGVGFYTEYEQLPYTPNPSFTVHPFLQYATVGNTGSGEYDRQGTASYGGPIICTVTLSKSDLANVEAFGMMVKHDLALDSIPSPPKGYAYKRSRCSVYDRLFLSLVARDN